MALKDLKLSLIIEALDRATAPIRKIGSAVHGLEERLGKIGKVFHKLGLAEFLGAGAAIAGVAELSAKVYELTNRVAEYGETALHASIKTGAGVEQMQRWFFAARQLGVDPDAVTRGFGMMEQHVSMALSGNKESRGALKLLGIDPKELRKLSNDPGAMVERLMAGFQSLPNATARMRVGRDMFGRQFMDLAPLLLAPREDIKKFFGEIDKAGGVMSKADTEAAERFIQAKGEMGAAVGGLERKIGVALIPTLTDCIEKITAWIENLSPAAVKTFTDAINQLARDLTRMLPDIEKVIVAIVTFTDKVLVAIDKSSVFKGVMIALAVVMAAQATIAFVTAAVSVARIGIAAVAAAGQIAMLIPLVTGLSSVFGIFDLVLAANPIGLVVLGITALVAVITAVGIGVYQIYKHWDGIVDWFWALWAKVTKIFGDAWKTLSDLTPDWLKALFKLAGAGISLTINGLGAAAHALGLGGPPHGSPGAPGAPPALNPRAHVAGQTTATPPHRVDLHLHLTGPGAPAVKNIKTSDSSTSLTVDRGQIFA